MQFFGLFAGFVAALPVLAAAEVPSVIADMPVTGALVADVMGDLGAPVVLLEQGADVHDYQLRPSQAGAVAGAALVIWVGPELTPWLVPILGQRSHQGGILGLLDISGATVHVSDAGRDPHAWLDPDIATLWLAAIGAALTKADPDHAAIYAENTAKAQASLAKTDAMVRARLAPALGIPLLVSHDGYGYFAGHFGLTLLGSVENGDAATPGAAHLADLREKLAALGQVCAFPEVLHDTGLLENVIDGTQAKSGAALDPEGAAIPPGPGFYAALLNGLATAISGCAADLSR